MMIQPDEEWRAPPADQPAGTVGAWELRFLSGRKPVVVLGKSPKLAKHHYMRVEDEAKLSVADYSITSFAPVKAYRMGELPAAKHGFFSSREDALAAAGPDARIRVVDPWFAFAEAEPEDLWRWLRMVWGYSWDQPNEIRKILPAITKYRRHKNTSVVLARMRQKQNYLAQAAYLRLSMLLPWLVSEHKGKEFDFYTRTDGEHGAAFVDLHKPNIGKDRATNLLSAAASKLSRVPRGDQAVRDAAASLVRAYGYDPDKMTWCEVEALWDGGPVALKQARIKVELGLHDKFGSEN